ncbi:MAG: right-handed parallel beta-helix repeat-containing protein [Chitinophagaceae bacterium]
MKHVFLMTVCFLFLMKGNCKDFYVDAVAGNDNNNGLSKNVAWRTLEKVSNNSFTPGDIIAFKTGQRFVGTLHINSSGTEFRPLIYTTFGGATPSIIDGNGDSTSIYCLNHQYINLTNLAVTNFRNGVVTKDDVFTGIRIINQDAGTLHHFHLDSVRVYNVNSTHIAKDEGKNDQSRFYGGVLFYTRGDKVRSNFDGVMITHSSFENLSRTGFNFRSDWDRRSAFSKFGDSIGKGMTDNWTPNTHVVFRDNHFKNIAGNGLIVRVATGALIEHNLFDSCGVIISGNAVFNFNTDGTVYQYNEAKNTIYNEGDTDARGIDSDYRTKNTTIQYNYLHDNGLGGVTATGGPGVGDNPVNFNMGTIIRYNIIENNARQGVYISGRVEGLEMYNNVVYADARFNDVVAIKLNKWTVYPNGSSFSNNIFCFKGTNASYAFTSATNVLFSHNLYSGILPPTEFKDPFPLDTDPRFMAPGTGWQGYKLLKKSPAILAGTAIKSNVEKDFYGNRIDKNKVLNIGIENIIK